MKTPKKNPGKSRRYSHGLIALASMAATTGLLAQAAPTPETVPASTADADSEIVELTPFEVSGQKDEGYIATETLAGTRIRSDLRDLGSAISVVTKTMMDDIGATDATTLLQYTTNTEVAGTRGTFSGLNGQNDEGNALRNPGQAQRVRGLTSADNTRDYFVTDIPWDSYNTDRIDILRGPNSFLFGLGSPAGIQNGSLQNASFKNEGQLSHRVGSYGSQRASLNVNQELIDDVLSIRVAGLWDHENFRQHPAYEDDERVYAALRFDPKLFKNKDFRTSIKLKYEAGDIKANRQRNMTPIDNLTAWFRPVDNTSAAGGMGKLAINTPYQARRTTDDSLENGYGAIDSSSMNYSPWLSDTVNAQQPYWTMNGDTGETYRVHGGWINAGAYGSNGKLTGVSDGVPNRWNSGNIYSVKGYGGRATDGKYPLPLSQFGGYRNQSLTDSSIFDFYRTLIDGDNKSEFQRWTAYNIDVSQTGWNDRVGLNLIYDRQRNKTGGESLLGWAPAITIDITENLDDYYLTSDGSGITNPNFGRPFVTGAGGNGGSWTYTDREYMRGSLFAELRTSDLTDNKFLIKLLGKHRFNGVASKDDYFMEYRAWQMYANSQAWNGYWNANSGATWPFTDRAPTAIIYLGDSIANLSSASGANIPGINSRIELQDSPVRVFDPTPTVDLSVYDDPWTIPAGSTLLDVFNPNNTSRPLTQESNPANMVGWTNYTQNALMRGNGGENLEMLTKAEMTKKETTSFAGSYQGFFWNDAFIPTLGWRYDKVKTKGVRAKVNPSNRNILNMADDVYVMPDEYADAETVTGHSFNWGGVLHLNRLFKNDPLPINIGVSYTKSDNFQVTSIRRDLYGTPLDNPSGETKEYGITLSTKDNKYSVRVTKFETSMKGVNAGLSDMNIGGILANGLNWRNVFLYELGGYVYSGRGQPSYRNRWTNAYPKYVQDANGNSYAEGSAEYTAGMAAATARMDEAIRGWNEIQKYLDTKGFFQAWNFTPTGPDTALVDRTTYLSDPVKYAPTETTVYSYAPSQPQGFTVTADTLSKGYEFEFIANPTPNWRISFNAAKTDASINNVGGASLTEFVEYMNSKMMDTSSPTGLTAAGEVPRWGGAGSCIGSSVWAPWYAGYQKLKLKEGTTADEVREWRFNVITNYSFREGFLKGTGIGAAYRWQDKVVLGYPMTSDGLYDLGKPYCGPTEGAMDAWLSYERKLTQKINWKIQLNVRNIFAKNELIPIYIQPDGQTWATARVAPAREWSITNTFSY